MLEVTVYNTAGKKVDTLQIDEARLGGTVNAPLLKQAVVAYHANKRQGTAATKGRKDVSGSTRKLFKQKGTGNARRGNVRTHVLRGGGVSFAKKARDFGKGLPRKMRRRALESALLAKILGENLVVVEGLKVDAPKTKVVVDVLAKLNIDRSCLLALAEHDPNIYRSARNIPGVAVRVVDALNAFDVVTRQKLLVTREAIDVLLRTPA